VRTPKTLVKKYTLGVLMDIHLH